ncbi:MAG: helix-turn-helix domain-containing protein, partial [Defluviitaleaceae bacterium]|nr:helix-turn-helix domain-containing protein [Defluviitaleaceae bacterium]
HQGSSIGDFMAKIRINHAKSIMGGESLGDEDIAERVGFSDGRHLRGIFKRYEGMTTADYRRTLRSSSNKEFSL